MAIWAGSPKELWLKPSKTLPGRWKSGPPVILSQTDYGYHIIQVLGHEKRQLTSDELATAQKAAYQQYITDAKTELGTKKYDVWAQVVPAEPTIPAANRIDTSATASPN